MTLLCMGPDAKHKSCWWLSPGPWVVLKVSHVPIPKAGLLPWIHNQHLRWWSWPVPLLPLKMQMHRESALPPGLISRVWDQHLLLTLSFCVSPDTFPQNPTFPSNFEFPSVYHALHRFQSSWVALLTRWVTNCCLPATRTLTGCTRNTVLLIGFCGCFKEIYGDLRIHQRKWLPRTCPWRICSLNQALISKCLTISSRKVFSYRLRNDKRQITQASPLSSMFRLGQQRITGFFERSKV